MGLALPLASGVPTGFVGQAALSTQVTSRIPERCREGRALPGQPRSHDAPGQARRYQQGETRFLAVSYHTFSCVTVAPSSHTSK